MRKLYMGLVGIYCIFAFIICSFLMNVYTAYTVYLSYSFLLALLAFCTPILSTIIMFFISLINNGLDSYCVTVLIYLGIVGLGCLLAYSIRDKENK